MNREGRRGRPPHPDILTPREWEVLGLLREGLTNPQVAGRLGISADAAKYHVGQILSKLGVSTREEAAAWQPEPAAAPVRRPAWASALAPFAAFLRGLSLAGRAALIGGALAVLAGIVVLLYGVLSSGGDEPGGVIEVPPTQSPTPGGPTDSNGNGAVITRPIGDPIDVPQGAVMIVEAGCFQCDGPGTGLFRVFKLADGETVVQQLFSAGPRYFTEPPGVLFEANGVGLPTSRPATVGGVASEEEPYVTGWALSGEGDTLIAGLCVRGFCGGGVAGLTEDARTILYQSVDGGVTWSEYATFDSGVWPLDVDVQGRILVAEWTDPDPNVPASFFFEPGHDPVPRPEVVPERTFPTILDGEQVVWAAAGAWFLPDGSVLRDLPVKPSSNSLMYGGSSGPVAIHVGGPGANLEVYDGKSEDVEKLNIPQLWSVAGWAAGPQLFGNITYTTQGQAASVPAILYDKNGFVSPITEPFLDSDFEKGRNRVIAVFISPAAIVSGTGSCLNVRADPSLESAVLDCVPDGVILHVVAPDGGDGWLYVASPSGAQGYASTDFLGVIALPPSED